MRNEFIKAVKTHQQTFELNLTDEKIHQLADYYAFIQKHNEILHLVAPCSAEEFAIRHILESLTVLNFLPVNSRFVDIGTGAGLPSIPCLIAREDLRAVLIESKIKKTEFLQAVLSKFDLESRAEIINRQFEETTKPDVSYILCRALDKFTKKLAKIVKWSGNSSLLFFGGNNLREELKNLRLNYTEKLMPESEQRYLFYVKN